jgi:quercetin dioxygenase-like cupin family protein
VRASARQKSTKEIDMRVRAALFGAVLCLCLAPVLWAQDATKVDSKHYTVITDNEQMRILKVHYGPHEKSVMHSHPAGAAVFLTDGKVKFTFPDGKTQDETAKAGDARYTPAVTHQPENVGDKPFEVILIELKGKGAAAAKPAKTEKK